MRIIRLILAGGIGGMLLAAAPAPQKPVPWKTGDAPPTVNGVKLGDTEQRALDLLGPPDEANSTTTGELLEYRTRGLEVTCTKDGVIAMRLVKPEAGSIDGISVGDIARAVILKWGVPTGGTDRTAVFGTPAWIIAVHLSDKTSMIDDMTLASQKANPAIDSSKLNVFQTQ
jgi:hypothetical protein